MALCGRKNKVWGCDAMFGDCSRVVVVGCDCVRFCFVRGIRWVDHRWVNRDEKLAEGASLWEGLGG